MAERDWQADLELCEGASPGPWKIGPVTRARMGLFEQDFAFVEAAREGWPAALRWILDRAKKRAEVEAMKDALDVLETLRRERDALRAACAAALERMEADGYGAEGSGGSGCAVLAQLRAALAGPEAIQAE